MPDVSVAMATHNGARFLSEQLASIAAQTLLPAELVVSDDVSTDDTIGIVERFSRDTAFPVEVTVNERKLGAGANFMRAAARCSSSLVAFSDQDDVWLPGKLSRCVPFFADSDVQLVIHGWTVVDGALQKLAEISAREEILEPFAAPKWGQAPGMAMVFRRELLDRYDWDERPPSHEAGRELLHDEWIYGLARVTGRIAYVGEPLCLYRQHGANVEGAPDGHVARRMSEAVSIGGEYYTLRAAQARHWARLLERFSDNGSLREAASYRRLASASECRAAVHDPARGTGGRLRALVRAARGGAYGRRTSDGFGLRGFLRDLLLVLLGRGA